MDSSGTSNIYLVASYLSDTALKEEDISPAVPSRSVLRIRGRLPHRYSDDIKRIARNWFQTAQKRQIRNGLRRVMFTIEQLMLYDGNEDRI